MLATLSILAACQTTPTTGIDRATCSVLPSITYSGKNDTPETIDQVRRFNAARARLCG